MRTLYHLIWIVLSPLVPLVWKNRAARGKEDVTRRHERFGLTITPRPTGPLIWLHGASVGESLSLLVLINELQKAHPAWRYLVTTGTVTSAHLMAQRLPPSAIHQFVPYDHPAWVRRFLSHWRPDGVLWCESEIWPGMLGEIRARRIPAALLNARMSQKSATRWHFVNGWMKDLISAFQFIAAQTPADAHRFRHFTAAPVLELGNLKFVNARLPVDAAAAAALRPQLQGRTVWAIASTHAGEELLAADLHWVLKQEIPNLLTIVALRHPDRSDVVAAEIATRGTVTRRSKGEAPTSDIYLWDTLGEMGTLYDAVKIVAIGGSFVPTGGHNPIEPAQFGNTVIVGPHMFNFNAIMEAFDAEHAVLHAANATVLTSHLKALFTTPAEVQALGARAEAVCQQQAQTLPNIIAALSGWRDAVVRHAA